VRLVVVAVLFYQFGASARALLEKYFNLLSFLLLVVLIGIILLIQIF